MKPLIIIQARTGSTRLPRKMTRDFHSGKSVLEILLERLLHGFVDKGYGDMVVATTLSPNDDAIVEVCDRVGVKSYRGSEADVLQRFIDTARLFGAEKIIRVCADNVFLDTDSLRRLAEEMERADSDYVSFHTRDGQPSILTHYGFFAEGVTLEALERVAQLTDLPLYHEHVTNGIHSGPWDFTTRYVEIEEMIPGLENHPDLRLTLDTESDFTTQQKIYADLQQRGSEMTPAEIIRYLDSEHPEYYSIMHKTINENKK